MKFYLPNFEDLVDPEFDFKNDQYSPKRQEVGRYNHDWYAHQFYDEPIFDGMLISKTVVTASAEKRIRESGGVHAYCRLDPTIPVMGDCGAFTYFDEDVPPYDVSEILAYYSDLGFTSGVSIDHLIFTRMPMAERERRLEITLQNAKAFLSEHQAEGHQFIPVGIAQGWDPSSRREAIEQLLDIGYNHLALGGMVRSKDKEIRATLEAIHPILPGGIHFHLFGIARLSLLPDLLRLGVTSADSASPIRRAFLGTGEDNYWALDGNRYAAIRVPTAKTGANKKRGVISTEDILEKNGVGLETIREMEQTALGLLRAYDKNEAGLEETLVAVLEYDRLHGEKRNHEKAYRRTLVERPWQSCGCSICEKYGVEVIIFRGNNRNRRRGFHNAWAFSKLFRASVSENKNINQDIDSYTNAYQPTLGLDTSV